ncbi:MAG: magnesium transporter, partial [Acidobacteriota bacterium]
HVYTSRWQSYKKRIPWLAVNLATLMVAANVVGIYETTIAAWPFLAIFLPVVAGLGGNAGTQALALTVRGLALGEISWSSSRSAVFKELVLGLGNGITIGLLAGVAGFFWIGNLKLGLILGAAVIINLLVAGIIGSAIPLILTRLRIDPAVASSMLLTTITDAVGFFAFLAMAFRFL